MSRTSQAVERVLVREHYALHLRRVRRLQWSSESRPTYAVLFLLEGAWRWQAAEAEAGERPAPSALLVQPGRALEVRGERVGLLTLTLAPAFVLDCAVRARLARDDAEVTFKEAAVAGDERLARFARDLADELREGHAGQEMVVAALVEHLLVHLLRRHAHVRRSQELELSRVGLVDRRVRRAVELMHAHLDAELPLEELASAAFLSPFHFARLFKKVTGTSPHAYLAALRIERAQKLLASTDLSVTEIGSRVGYQSPSHFAKAFRTATGLTPRAFRESLVGR